MIAERRNLKHSGQRTTQIAEQRDPKRSRQGTKDSMRPCVSHNDHLPGRPDDQRELQGILSADNLHWKCPKPIVTIVPQL